MSGDGLERYSLDAEIIGDSEVSLMKSGGLNSRTISLMPISALISLLVEGCHPSSFYGLLLPRSCCAW